MLVNLPPQTVAVTPTTHPHSLQSTHCNVQYGNCHHSPTVHNVIHTSNSSTCAHNVEVVEVVDYRSFESVWYVCRFAHRSEKAQVCSSGAKLLRRTSNVLLADIIHNRYLPRQQAVINTLSRLALASKYSGFGTEIAVKETCWRERHLRTRRWIIRTYAKRKIIKN